MHLKILEFGIKNLKPEEITGKRVLEVGSYDMNGSIRPYIESNSPKEYIGTDMCEGPGVDLACGVEDLVKKFGKESFDLVIVTEVLEHVPNWKKAITNIKSLCKKDGIIFITSPAKGFPYHPCPKDYWRFNKEDFKIIFADCEILMLEEIQKPPTTMLKCQKPQDFKETDTTNHTLFSIVTGTRVKNLNEKDFQTLRFLGCKIIEKAAVTTPIDTIMEYIFDKRKKQAEKFLAEYIKSGEPHQKDPPQ